MVNRLTVMKRRSARLSLKRTNGLHKRQRVTEIRQQNDVHRGLSEFDAPSSSRWKDDGKSGSHHDPTDPTATTSISNSTSDVRTTSLSCDGGPVSSPSVTETGFVANLAPSGGCEASSGLDYPTPMSCDSTVCPAAAGSTTSAGHQMESERAMEEKVDACDEPMVPSSSSCSTQGTLDEVDCVADPTNECNVDLCISHDDPLSYALSVSEMAQFEDFSVPQQHHSVLQQPPGVQQRHPGTNSPIKRQTSLFSFLSRTSRSQSTPAAQVMDAGEDCRRLAAHMSSVSELQPAKERGTTSELRQRDSECQPPKFNDRVKKTCPFYKKIPGTKFFVDAFSYGSIPDCSAYFLSHFHYDHYMGLTRKFQHPIYCSKVTANLVIQKLRVPQQYIHALDMNTPHTIDGVEITLLDANHCPGSVLLLFKLSSGRLYLHTGDFRYCPAMKDYPQLKSVTISQLFLDTTYCSPEYTFPRQEEVIAFAVDKAAAALHTSPGTLVVCGSYTIGKERVFMGLARTLGLKVFVDRDKRAILECLESSEILSVLTTDPHSAGIHVLPMAKLNVNGLSLYLEQSRSKFTNLLAFKPTGWTYSSKTVSLSSIKPQTRGPVTLYGIPYSEHSSFSELREFVRFLRPQKIIPTVNNGSAKKREDMQTHFKQWLTTTQQTRTKQTTLFHMKS